MVCCGVFVITNLAIVLMVVIITWGKAAVCWLLHFHPQWPRSHHQSHWRQDRQEGCSFQLWRLGGHSFCRELSELEKDHCVVPYRNKVFHFLIFIWCVCYDTSTHFCLLWCVSFQFSNFDIATTAEIRWGCFFGGVDTPKTDVTTKAPSVLKLKEKSISWL